MGVVVNCTCFFPGQFAEAEARASEAGGGQRQLMRCAERSQRHVCECWWETRVLEGRGRGTNAPYRAVSIGLA